MRLLQQKQLAVLDAIEGGGHGESLSAGMGPESRNLSPETGNQEEARFWHCGDLKATPMRMGEVGRGAGRAWGEGKSARRGTRRRASEFALGATPEVQFGFEPVEHGVVVVATMTNEAHFEGGQGEAGFVLHQIQQRHQRAQHPGGGGEQQRRARQDEGGSQKALYDQGGVPGHAGGGQ